MKNSDLAKRIDQFIIASEGTERGARARFCKKIDASSPNIAAWLKGNSAPNAEFQMKMHDVYGLNLKWLLFGEGDMFGKGGGEEKPSTTIMFDTNPDGSLGENIVPASAVHEARIEELRGVIAKQEEELKLLRQQIVESAKREARLELLLEQANEQGKAATRSAAGVRECSLQE